MYYKWLVLLFSFSLIGIQSLTAQGIYVESTEGDVYSLNISSVDNSVFPLNNVVFNMANNTTQTFSLLMVKKIYFAPNTGVSEDIESGSTLTVFPNPTSDEIEIKNAPESETDVFIYSIEGRLMIQTTISSHENKIDVSKLSNGLYIVKMNSLTTKIIKQ